MRISFSPIEFRELLLSHHPNFPCFNNDVIILFDRRICAGCLLGYPTALSVLLIFKPTGFESIILSLILATISQILKFYQEIGIRHLSRLIAGVALGFGLGGAYWALLNGEWLSILVLFLGGSAYFLLKAHSIKKALKKELCINN